MQRWFVATMQTGYKAKLHKIYEEIIIFDLPDSDNIYLLQSELEKMVFDCCLKIRRLLASNHTYPDPYQCPNLTTLTVVLPFLWQRSQCQVIQTYHPLLPHSQPMKSPHFPPHRHVRLLILSTALQILHLLTRPKQGFLPIPLVSFLTCRLALSWNKALTVIQLDHKYQTPVADQGGGVLWVLKNPPFPLKVHCVKIFISVTCQSQELKAPWHTTTLLAPSVKACSQYTLERALHSLPVSRCNRKCMQNDLEARRVRWNRDDFYSSVRACCDACPNHFVCTRSRVYCEPAFKVCCMQQIAQCVVGIIVVCNKRYTFDVSWQQSCAE